MIINQAIKIATKKLKQKNIPSADLDAEVLLLEALNRYRKNIDKSWLYMNNDYELNKREEKLFNGFVKQRLRHKPVAYITNKKEFYGYEFYVNENVLIPRPETEFMVEEVLKIIDDSKNKFTLIDIGAGSGCVIISVLNEIEKDRTNGTNRTYWTNICGAYANDISSEAIKIAKLNAKKYNLNKKIKFIAGDFGKFMKEKISSASNQFIITANLPYIKNDEYKNLSPNVRKYEPKISLVGGKSGIELIEKLINSISNIKIKNNSEDNNLYNHIILEADPAQMKKIKSILKKKLSAVDIKIIKDLRGKNRLISAKIQQISPN